MVITRQMWLQYEKHLLNDFSLSKNTKKAYLSDMHLLKSWLTNNNFTEIDSVIINSFFTELKSNYKPSSLKRKYITLKSICKYFSAQTSDIDPSDKYKLNLPKIKKLPKTLAKNQVKNYSPVP